MMKTSHLIALTMTVLVVGCAPESGEPIDLDAERHWPQYEEAALFDAELLRWMEASQ